MASAFTSELGKTLGKEDSRLTWTGRLSPSTYVGNGTFQLANGEIGEPPKNLLGSLKAW